MIKKRFNLITGSLVILISALISGCSFTNILNDPTPTPTRTITVTPTTTFTPPPSSTPSPQPTDTLQPSLTPTVDMPIIEKEEQVFHGGEFAFNPIWGYYMDYDDYNFVITDEEQNFTIMFSDLFLGDEEINQENLNEYMLATVMERMNVDFEIISDQPIQIDGMDGTLIEYTGDITGKEISGKTILINRGGGRILYGIGLGFTFSGIDQWAADGQQVFNSVLSTLHFITAEPGTCQISTDPDYGYTQAKAIRVGGGAFDGPPRERYYLDNLLGPNGEEVTYQRLGSLNFEDTILDEYEIVYGNTTVILYIDEYAFERPLAPVGFTCWDEFPLSQP